MRMVINSVSIDPSNGQENWEVTDDRGRKYELHNVFIANIDREIDVEPGEQHNFQVMFTFEKLR